MSERELDKFSKQLDEFVNQYSTDSVMGKVIPDITKIIMLNYSKGYIEIKKEDIIHKIYELLLKFLPFKFEEEKGLYSFLFDRCPSEFGEKEKLESILYIFNHPDFNEYSHKFLSYLKKEVKNARSDYLKTLYSGRFEENINGRNI